MIEARRTVFVAKDGKEFLSKKEAIEHERKVERTKYFIIHGRKNEKTINLVVEAEDNHLLIAEMVALKYFRQVHYFHGGVIKAMNITPLWYIQEINKDEMDKKDNKLELIENTDHFNLYFA